jgi:hypothetical protein
VYGPPELAKLVNLDILDHGGTLLKRRRPHTEQAGERRREF